MKKYAVSAVALLVVGLLGAQAKEGAAGDHGSKPAKEHKTFEQVDTSGDGKINLDEFKAAAPAGKDAASVEAYFKKRDVNADGAITKDEWDQWHKADHGHGKQGEATK